MQTVDRQAVFLLPGGASGRPSASVSTAALLRAASERPAAASSGPLRPQADSAQAEREQRARQIAATDGTLARGTSTGYSSDGDTYNRSSCGKREAAARQISAASATFCRAVSTTSSPRARTLAGAVPP